MCVRASCPIIAWDPIQGAYLTSGIGFGSTVILTSINWLLTMYDENQYSLES